MRSVIEQWLDLRLSRRETRRIAKAILAWRLFDLVGDTVAEAAAEPLADRRATLYDPVPRIRS